MPTSRLKMDAITLVAAARTNDEELTQTILGSYETHADLATACADVAALLAGTGAGKNAIAGYLDYIGAITVRHRTPTRAPS